MSAKLLVLALLFGCAGGAVSALTLRALPGVPDPAGPPGLERELAQTEPPGQAEAGAEPPVAAAPPVLQGSPVAEERDRSWRQGVERRLSDLARSVSELAEEVRALDEGKAGPDLARLSVEELRARAATLYAFKNYAGTLEAYEALLAREHDLDLDTRSELLSRKAQCHRALGDLDEADAVFREVEALHGPGSARAMTARYQRAWIRHARSDVAGAREFMREVARGENSPAFWKLFARANAADFSIQLGETVGVREDLEEFRGDLTGDDSQTGQRVLGYVNRLLEQLDAL